MGITENWNSFVEMTRAKAESHAKVAQYWDTVHNALSLTLIFLSAATTLCTLLPVHNYIPAGLGAATTLVSAISGFMAPSARRQIQTEASKAFRSLMLRMVRCETEREYEELWKEYTKELLGEPFLPKKYKVAADTNFTMSPEFMLVVAQKQHELSEGLGNYAAAQPTLSNFENIVPGGSLEKTGSLADCQSSKRASAVLDDEHPIGPIKDGDIELLVRSE